MRKKVWTEEDIKFLKKHYPKKGAAYIAEKLNCSVRVIQYKAAELKIVFKSKYRIWEKWELNFLLRHKNNRTYASMARSLKRSKNAVEHKLQQLGSIYQRRESWSEAEAIQFRELYQDKSIPIREIAKIMNKSFSSVNYHARVFNLRRNPMQWSDKERKYLARNYRKKSFKKLSEVIGRSPDAIEAYAIRNGLLKRSHFRLWTEEEMEFLRSNFKFKNYEQLSNDIGRTKKAVERMAKILGLTSKENRYKPASVEARKRALEKWYNRNKKL